MTIIFGTALWIGLRKPHTAHRGIGRPAAVTLSDRIETTCGRTLAPADYDRRDLPPMYSDGAAYRGYNLCRSCWIGYAILEGR